MNFFIGSTSKYGSFGTGETARRAFAIKTLLSSAKGGYITFMQIRDYLRATEREFITPNKMMQPILMLIDKGYDVRYNVSDFYASRIYRRK